MTDHEPEYLVGFPEDQYFAASALSASQMKHLLVSPKHFRAALQAPREDKTEFDIGHAVHARILGVGMPVVEIPRKLLSADGGIRSKDAKSWVAEARAAGKIPLKAHVYQLVVRASDAVLMHPKCRPLLEAEGDSEVSMFASDPATHTRIRGRADRVMRDGTILDVKSLREISRRALRRVIDGFSYDLSMENYRFLFELCTGDVPPASILIAVEKEPPYDVQPVVLGQGWQDGGWRKLRTAIELFARCTESGVWPGLDDDEGPILELDPPGWYVSANERAALDEAVA